MIGSLVPTPIPVVNALFLVSPPLFYCQIMLCKIFILCWYDWGPEITLSIEISSLTHWKWSRLQPSFESFHLLPVALVQLVQLKVIWPSANLYIHWKMLIKTILCLTLMGFVRDTLAAAGVVIKNHVSCLIITSVVVPYEYFHG